jgi:MFS family permease
MFKDINKVVRVLVVTDFFYNGAFASFAPVFAIFIAGSIVGGSASVAGYATAMYWVTKSLVQLPIARFLDRAKGEGRGFSAMFLGYLASGFVPLAYIFAETPLHLYIIQAFYGFAMAWAVPSWYGVFTRHVDKWRISFEWSLESVFAVGLSSAIAAALGGFIADRFGFEALFFLAAVISFGASFFLLTLRKSLLPHRTEERVLPDRKGAHPHGR